MQVTNQSDTWQDLTRVKPRVTSAEASDDRDFVMPKSLDIENPEIAICDFTI
jgi:hypothetical protein